MINFKWCQKVLNYNYINDAINKSKLETFYQRSLHLCHFLCNQKIGKCTGEIEVIFTQNVWTIINPLHLPWSTYNLSWKKVKTSTCQFTSLEQVLLEKKSLGNLWLYWVLTRERTHVHYNLHPTWKIKLFGTKCIYLNFKLTKAFPFGVSDKFIDSSTV